MDGKPRNPASDGAAARNPTLVLTLGHDHRDLPVGSAGGGPLQQPRSELGGAVVVRVEQHKHTTLLGDPVALELHHAFKLARP